MTLTYCSRGELGWITPKTQSCLRTHHDPRIAPIKQT